MKPRFPNKRTTAVLMGVAVFAAAPALAAAPASAEPSSGQPAFAPDAVSQRLVERIGDAYAGSYLDDGATVVNVTGDDAARQARAAGYDARVVDDDLAALGQLKADLDEFAGTAGTTGLSWGVDIVDNAVVVSVPRQDDDKATASFVDSVRSLSGDVRVEEVASAPQPVLGPGDAILTGGSRCSASAIATDGSQDFVVTAGHCTNIGSQWTTSGGETIGTTDESVFPGSDYGTIQVTNSSLDISNGQLTEVGEPPVGTSIEKAGSTTGITSGEILAYDVTVNYPEGALHGMIESNVCVQPGDSGGSLYATPTAIGITSGGTLDIDCASSEFRSFFQPLGAALDATGLSLK